MELMVALAVLMVLAAIARVGLRRNERAGQYRRFVADVHGAVIRAHDRAIDRQGPVRIDLDATSLVTRAWDPVTDIWEPVDRVRMDEHRAGLLLGDGVCIEGLVPGVMAPSQADAVETPSGCVEQPQQLRFESDGTLTVAGSSSGPTEGLGVTLWIGDRSLAASPVHALVQVFPGGLIRVFEGVR